MHANTSMNMPSTDVIVKDRDILGGTPVFRGTRVPFQALLDYHLLRNAKLCLSCKRAEHSL